MDVKSELKDAQLEIVENAAAEAILDNTLAKVRYRADTNEIVIGDGLTKQRIKVSVQHVVGDIKASMLDEANFQAEMKDDTWTLADGKPVPGSLYATLVGPNVPDLGGQFLRGASVDNTVDPDGPRSPGDVQADQLKDHTHVVRTWFGSGGGGVYRAQGVISLTENTTGSSDTQGVSGAGPETRPKNVAVNYYIKINR